MQIDPRTLVRAGLLPLLDEETVGAGGHNWIWRGPTSNAARSSPKWVGPRGCIVTIATVQVALVSPQ